MQSFEEREKLTDKENWKKKKLRFGLREMTSLSLFVNVSNSGLVEGK